MYILWQSWQKAVFATVIGSAVAALAGAPAAQAKSLWDKIKDTGVLTCGAMPANPVGSWAVPGPAKYEGYEINLCRQIALDLSIALGKNIRVEYQETTWGTVVLDLQAGRIDLWPGMSETAKRKKAIDMAGPMYELAHCYVNRKGLTGLTTWDQYSKPSIRVASIMGTSDEAAVKQNSPNATHQGFRQQSEAVLSVQSQRSDAFGTSVLTCLRILKEHSDVFGEVVFPTPIWSRPSSAGMRKDGDGRFHKWLQNWAVESRKSGKVTWLLSDAIAKGGLDVSRLPSGFNF